MALDAIGSDGINLDLDSAPTTLTYNADGTLNTVSIVWSGNTYVQTYGYTSGRMTSISAWVKQ